MFYHGTWISICVFSKLKVGFQVQAVLLLLGQGELPPGSTGMVLPNQNENKVRINSSAVCMAIILSVFSSSMIN